jgi:peptidoglycan lytic transglycosylase G
MIHAKSFLYGTLCSTVFLSLIAVVLHISTRAASIWKETGSPGFSTHLDEGENFSALVSRMTGVGVLPHRAPLVAYARLTGVDRLVKPGRFEVGAGWSPVQILEQATLGTNAPRRVTVAPGVTLLQCADTLAVSGWVSSATDWIRHASGSAVLAKTGRPTLEGLLAPDTYFFESSSDTEEVLARLNGAWSEFIQRVAGTSDLDGRLSNGLTLYETIILASVVEKEAANTVEMATVSSVFHNRLRKGWQLGSAATIRYAIGDWERGERSLPVNLKSRYNTMRNSGLPPTPICMPGREAIRAAIHPADTDYMFFVADGQGGTIFNKTHKAHVNSVRDYRRKQNRKAD